MLPRCPAEVGMRLEEVDTPALLLELDAFERNLRRLHEPLTTSGVRVRPHAKSHKCPEIARRQIAAGAVGVCCQKVGEAEAMVEGGVADVLVSNEIVGAPKLARLAALANRARIGVCVDDPGNVRDLDAAAHQAGTLLEVLVEIDVGAKRCGVEPGRPALALAQQVAGCAHLRFRGLQAYNGSAQHRRPVAERAAAIAQAAALARETQALLQENGIPCPVVTGAGTGTYPFEAASGVYTELQAGSYIFMDADYNRNEWPDGASPFEQSLFVWSTVMSRPVRHRAVVDAGLKALSIDSGMPLVAADPRIVYARVSDEHGALDLPDAGCTLAVGDKLKLIPGHCDPTVNLYDWFVGIRQGRVESLWPITARGALL